MGSARMTTAQHLSGGSSATLTKPDHGRTIRLDIEGMRTIAVGSVLIAHAGVPFMAGGFVGVDVFFVLSGFLITGLLAREVSRTGRVSLSTFWARRMKRLLPASATVLVFSALVTYFFLPITQRKDFGGDIISAAAYVVNWRLADRGVDYLAEDIGQSPVQHYWSLAVEEQFYVVWPILMLVIGLVAAKRWKRGAFVVLGLATVASFAYSVQQTADSPATAYFVTTTRIWELGIGALLALAANQVDRLPSVLRAIGGWVGIALIAYAVFVFDESTTWPGANALVPTVGAALMIASGLSPTPGSPQRLLSIKPMVWIGGLSYSIYLWHWPILVAAQAERPDMRLRYLVLLMVLSIVPAYLSNRFIENPVRFGSFFKPNGRAIGMGLALTAVGVGVGLALNASVSLGSNVREASTSGSPGAAALLDPANKDVVWSDIKSVDTMRPLATGAVDDRPPFYDDDSGCQVRGGDPKPKLCEWGDTSSDRTVVIIGDSKMAQWQTALEEIAKDEGWKLIQITKSACPFTDASIDRSNKVDCRQWGRTALQDILELKPDLVIASHRMQDALPEGKTDDKDATVDAMADGMARYWKTLTDAGIPVVALLDNPAPTNQPVYECVAQNPEDLTACAFDRERGESGSGAPAALRAAKQVPGVKILDMSDTICPDGGRCSAVIGNVLVYRQGTHLTKTFVDSTKKQLADALHTASDGAFGRKLPD
ncbi:acyltransferase family protein [Aeromicrobium yanjiei]|uniref:Acyltransferase family protein n=2 Tax=Aeromicrobium yanjiei TaxID=2662028 RepID=A0A5Q2MK19_9ACTN|nr:acyltransferase family protein [Aeromicrobium yanjiei]